jgi:hypothetical protein
MIQREIRHQHRSNNRVPLRGNASKGERIQSKEQKEEDKEQVPLAHGLKNVYYTNRNISELV